MLARSGEVIYLVGMRKGNRWGFVFVGSVVASLLEVVGVSAQTPPASAPPPSIDDPSGAAQPTAAPPPAMQAQPVLTPPPPSQGQPPQPPRIELHKEPPLLPPVPRTDHNHDGFYARLSLGFGTLGTTMNAPNSGAIKGDGPTLGFDLALGYAVSSGIIVGATLMYESLPSVELSAVQPVTSDVHAGLLGPFFDGYPNSRGGIHLGGTLGLAMTRIEREEAAGFTKAVGFGLAGWVGYDLWVADQWSTGIQVQMMGTRTKADANATLHNNDAGSASMATRSISLMLTGLYN